MQPLIETLMTKFPEAVLYVEADTARSEVTVQVAADQILDVARFLHDAPEASFDHLTDICSVDYPEDRQRFEVVYHLHLERRRVSRTRSLRHDGHQVCGPSRFTTHPFAGGLCGRVSAEKRFPCGRSGLAQPVRVHPATRRTSG